MTGTLPAATTQELTPEALLEMYRTMLTIRVFEERAQRSSPTGEIPGFVHLYVGEEAVGRRCLRAPDRRDYVTSTHRGHGHCIAKGVDVARMMAEI